MTDECCATCARCHAQVAYTRTRLFWSPGRGAFRLCRRCANLRDHERLELEARMREWEGSNPVPR